MSGDVNLPESWGMIDGAAFGECSACKAKGRRIAELESALDQKHEINCQLTDQRDELSVQLAASQARECIMREALESMRGIYENQQMSTLTVAGKMLEVSMDALKEASTKSQPTTEEQCQQK